MTVETYVATWVEIEAIRGVSYYEEFSLFANTGTEAAPTMGDPLDLDDWPSIIVMIDVAADQTIVRGTVDYVSNNPARFWVNINYVELDKAFDAANRSRPLHYTVKALNTAGTQERPLQNGIIRVRESGY